MLCDRSKAGGMIKKTHYVQSKTGKGIKLKTVKLLKFWNIGNTV